MSTPENDRFVRSFARGLTVISALGRKPGHHSIASVAELTELPRAVARRILATLCELGYARVEGREFRLTPRVLTLGLSYLTSLPYFAHAQQALIEISSEIDESCAMAVMDTTEIVFIQRIPSRKVLSPNLVIGSRLPAYATSPGRVLLANLDPSEVDVYFDKAHLKAYTERTIVEKSALVTLLSEVREQGYAWVDRELDPDVSGLSVPVRDDDRNVVAALSVNVLSEGWTEAQAVKKFLSPLRRAASCIRFQ
ncbi:IclR family transcriptional regulator domain-containing protein [Pollutimonas bauzanensis]|uniref:Transcriptional regulator, IclR family n=1 Tax=Pollutimonas bauzanensis TaxID=658167 RepID=A0A1M5UN80_9BURK|nr:IclR family transcriptional regulator C-terminal domain-containing protein [Pollutimonas bauzanensis]SHH64328.1 transcriptional regulator, IclR family [Pollutimonas bauzanensis]